MIPILALLSNCNHNSSSFHESWRFAREHTHAYVMCCARKGPRMQVVVCYFSSSSSRISILDRLQLFENQLEARAKLLLHWRKHVCKRVIETTVNSNANANLRAEIDRFKCPFEPNFVRYLINNQCENKTAKWAKISAHDIN